MCTLIKPSDMKHDMRTQTIIHVQNYNNNNALGLELLYLTQNGRIGIYNVCVCYI